MDDKQLWLFFHDVRAPLVGIRGYLPMILDGSFGDLPKEAKEKLQLVCREVERLHGMIEDIIAKAN